MSIGSGPSSPTGKRAFGFTVNEPATISCRLDEGGFATCSSPVEYEALADGSHSVTVRAVDPAGNAGTASRSWSVDATAPVLSVPADKVVEADAPTGSKIVYSVSGSDAGGALLPGAISCSPASGSRFPLGRTTVACTAEDALGNEGTASFSVTVRDTTPPTINAPDVSVTATSAAGARRTDPALAAYLNGVRATDLVSAVTIVNDAPEVLPVGQTRVVFTARDLAGNQSSKHATVTVLPRGTPAPAPDLTPPPDVRGARAVAGDHRVTLTWSPPRRDFAYVVVQRSARRRRHGERVSRHGAPPRRQGPAERRSVPLRDRRLRPGRELLEGRRARRHAEGAAARAPTPGRPRDRAAAPAVGAGRRSLVLQRPALEAGPEGALRLAGRARPAAARDMDVRGQAAAADTGRLHLVRLARHRREERRSGTARCSARARSSSCPTSASSGLASPASRAPDRGVAAW